MASGSTIKSGLQNPVERTLADEGVYLVGEASFHRAERAHGEINATRFAAAKPVAPPSTFIASRTGGVDLRPSD